MWLILAACPLIPGGVGGGSAAAGKPGDGVRRGEASTVKIVSAPQDPTRARHRMSLCSFSCSLDAASPQLSVARNHAQLYRFNEPEEDLQGTKRTLSDMVALKRLVTSSWLTGHLSSTMPPPHYQHSDGNFGHDISGSLQWISMGRVGLLAQGSEHDSH